MPESKFNHPHGTNECLNYQNPSNVTQRVQDFTDDVTVTLRNPQKIHNPTDTACTVFVQLRYDDSYTPVYLIAGGSDVCDVISIGKSSRGTTASDLIVRGVD